MPSLEPDWQVRGAVSPANYCIMYILHIDLCYDGNCVPDFRFGWSSNRLAPMAQALRLSRTSFGAVLFHFVMIIG
jgi:hypothetical protein